MPRSEVPFRAPRCRPLEFGIFSRLAERGSDANSWFGGRNAAVPGGGFLPPGQPEGLPEVSRGLSVSDPRNAVEIEPHPGGVPEIVL
jgi:hypothetical protein